MEAISYSYADKQAKRIKKFINDPDSTSGVVTVPKTIASGENITIPSGRVAVLPNVQIDGTLNVQGDVFIPSGATLSGVVEKVTSTDNAIVRFNGTTGDVQNSGVIIDDNGNMGVGTNNPQAKIDVFSTNIRVGDTTGGSLILGSSTTSSQNHHIAAVASDSSLRFYNGNYGAGTERMRIDANGNVGIGVVPSASTSSGNLALKNNGTIYFAGQVSYIDTNAVYNNNDTYVTTGYATRYSSVNGQHIWKTAPSGTAGNAITWSNAMTLANNGNLLIGTTTDNGVDKLQINGSVTHKSSLWKYSNLNNACTVDESTVVDNTCLNIPYNDYGYVTIQVSTPNSYCMQTFVGLNAPARFFVRIMAGGNWSAWSEK